MMSQMVPFEKKKKHFKTSYNRKVTFYNTVLALKHVKALI